MTDPTTLDWAQGYRPFTTCGEITAELVDIAEAEKITKWLLRAGHQRAADALLNDYPGPPSTLHVN